MTQILVTKPNTLTEADKSLLRASGVVVVEANEPNDVKLITADMQEIGGNDLLFAAVKAMATTGPNQNLEGNFVRIVSKLMDERRAAS